MDPAPVPSFAPSGVFDLVAGSDVEQVVFCHDRRRGLRAVIAVHSTVLGPALGGTRFHPYPSEAEALVDVLRLARAMTYKHAISGLDHGGGKAVILGDPRSDRTDDLIRAYAEHVDRLGGRYLTAEDVGTTITDMDLVREVTPHVTGMSEALGGSGDPSPATAWGVLWAMRAVAEHRWGDASLAGRHVAVSGLGKVGGALVGHLAAVGAVLTVADVRAEAVEPLVARHHATPVPHEKVHATECDIFAPCALGGILNATTIPELRCAAVCGSANNQLLTAADGQRLADAGVLYAPDYVVNAGGVINIAQEPGGYDRARAYRRIEGIAATTRRVLEAAEAQGITPGEAADRLARERIEQARKERAGNGPGTR